MDEAKNPKSETGRSLVTSERCHRSPAASRSKAVTLVAIARKIRDDA
jgi:hypothetical protein